jgi:hypothetical protein
VEREVYFPSTEFGSRGKCQRIRADLVNVDHECHRSRFRKQIQGAFDDKRVISGVHGNGFEAGVPLVIVARLI